MVAYADQLYRLLSSRHKAKAGRVLDDFVERCWASETTLRFYPVGMIRVLVSTCGCYLSWASLGLILSSSFTMNARPGKPKVVGARFWENLV